MSTTPATQRADIQGLRAVAVGTVIWAHAGLPGLTGGFVGVDVFFVISGFLITQLLVREAAGSGRISILDFYARRARRILPAASVVLICTAAASALWLGPVRAPGALEDIVWAAFFAINIHLAGSGTDYFAQGLAPSPVQHYWSLAVEEQFYLVWPLVMVLVMVVAARRRGRRAASPVRGWLAVIAAVTLASLVWSIVQTQTSPTVAYFSSFTRAWELGVGALGALWLASRRAVGGVVVLPDRWRMVAPIVGLALIAYACVAFDEATPFPSWRAAVPVLGSVLVLVGGAAGGVPSPAARLLGWAPLRVMGDWSYSLYLWHWPLLVVGEQYVGHALTPLEKVAVVAATFVLAAATYRFVENPTRRSPWLARPLRSVAVYPVTVALIAGSCLVAGTQISPGAGTAPAIALGPDWRTTYDTDDQAQALVAASVRAARRGHGIPADLRPALADVLDSTGDVGSCDYQDDTVRRLCPRGDVDSDRTLVLVGNSHGRHWIPAFDRIAQEYGYKTYYLVKVQCVAALVTPDTGDSTEPFEGCAQFHDWTIEQVRDLHPDLLVVSTSPTNRGVYDANGDYFSDRSDVDRIMKQGYIDMLKALAPEAMRTVMLTDIPFLSDDPTTCLGSPRASLRGCLMREQKPHLTAERDQEAAARAAGVESIATKQWFCAFGACPAVVGDLVPYRDAGHMTNDYSEHLAGPLAAALGLERTS